jgi:hypothetical protein
MALARAVTRPLGLLHPGHSAPQRFKNAYRDASKSRIYGQLPRQDFQGHSRGADRAGQRIGRGRDEECAVDEADQEPADWAALGIVGVQQGPRWSRCARPRNGWRGGAVVRSRPARQGHVTRACRRQDVRRVRQRRPGRRRLAAEEGWWHISARPVAGGRAGRRTGCRRGRGRRARCRGPACRRPLQGGEGFGAMAPYDARGS